MTGGRGHMPAMFEHLQNGELNAMFLITHRTSLEDVSRRPLFKDKEEGCVRAVSAP
jgi:threonine dehydrogenase-like Zn-dependent dehydrogenase